MSTKKFQMVTRTDVIALTIVMTTLAMALMTAEIPRPIAEKIEPMI